LRNPPNIPVLRGNPVETREPLFGGDSARRKSRGIPRQTVQEGDQGVEFKESKYFAPPDPRDPRNSLADLLTQSFSLSQEGSEPAEHNSDTMTGSRHNGNSRFSSLRAARLVDVLMLVFVLVLWLHAASVRHDYRTETMIGAMCICGTIAIRVTADTLADMRQERASSWASLLGVTLGLAELGAVAYVGLGIWNIRGGGETLSGGDAAEYGGPGGLAIGMMLAHQVWNTLL
jgi:hypothetical protein